MYQLPEIVRKQGGVSSILTREGYNSPYCVHHSLPPLLLCTQLKQLFLISTQFIFSQFTILYLYHTQLTLLYTQYHTILISYYIVLIVYTIASFATALCANTRLSNYGQSNITCTQYNYILFNSTTYYISSDILLYQQYTTLYSISSTKLLSKNQHQNRNYSTTNYYICGVNIALYIGNYGNYKNFLLL